MLTMVRPCEGDVVVAATDLRAWRGGPVIVPAGTRGVVVLDVSPDPVVRFLTARGEVDVAPHPRDLR